MTTLADMPPIQILCADTVCRRRQTVPLTDMYYVVVKGRHGGTTRDAGCSCRGCGREIVLPASHLRKGVLQLLPSKAALESSRAPSAPAAEPRRLPAWAVGDEAMAMLDVAVARISADGGDMVGLRMEDGMQQTVDLPDDADGILQTLDAEGCHLLVACGPNRDGSIWQVVLHPAAGAATLTSAG